MAENIISPEDQERLARLDENVRIRAEGGSTSPSVDAATADVLQAREGMRQAFENPTGWHVSRQRVAADRALKDAEKRRRDAELIELTRGNYDPANDLGDPWLAADMARSNLLSEKQAKFLRKYPHGQLRSVTVGEGEKVLLARTAPDEPEREVAKSALSILAQGVGPAEPIVGGVAAGLLTGGAGIIPGALATGGATFLGEMAQHGVERLRGFEEDTLGEAATSGVLSGSMATTADVAMRGATRLVRGGLNPTALITPSERLGRATDIAAAQGLPAVGVGQVSSSEMVRAAVRQSALFGGPAGRQQTEQRSAIFQRLKKMSESAFASLSDSNLESVIARQVADIDRLLPVKNVSSAVASKALKRGYEIFRTASRETRDRRYNDVHATISEDFAYDLRIPPPGEEKSLLAVANEINTGVLGRSIANKGTRVSQEPQGELRNVLDLLLGKTDETTTLSPLIEFKAAPGLGRNREGFNAFEQLQALRTRLFDLTQSEDPMVKREATRLWGSMRATMENPVGAVSADFQAKLKAANNFNRWRENILETDYVQRVLRSDTSTFGEMANHLLQPGKGPMLQLTRRIIPQENWALVQEKFKGRLLADPDQTVAMLKRWKTEDPEGLKLLITPQQEEMLGVIATEKIKMRESVASKFFNRLSEQGERAERLGSSSRAALRDHIDRTGGLDGQFATEARASLYAKLLNGASELNADGVRVIKPQRLVQRIDAMLERGNLNVLLRPDDVKVLKDLQLYTSVIGGEGDVGGVISRGAATASISRFMNPKSQIHGVHTIYGHRAMGWILAQPALRQELIKSKGAILTEQRLRIAAILGTIVNRQAAESEGRTSVLDRAVDRGTKALEAISQPTEPQLEQGGSTR